MPITLPDLRDTRCVSFASCGHIQTKDETLLKWLAKQPDWMTARRRYKKGFVYIRAGFGGREGTHCHVEVANPSFFSKPPKVDGTISQIQKILEHLAGQEIRCDLSGDFFVESGELPQFVRAMFLDIKEGNVSFRTAAGKFEVSGAPFRAVSWEFDDEGKNAMLKFNATQTTTVGDSYLVDGLQMILAGFAAFVGGGVPRGEK